MLARSEQKILTQCIKRSDVSAFNTLFEETQTAIFNFLYSKLGDVEAAEDILQEIYGVWLF